MGRPAADLPQLEEAAKTDDGARDREKGQDVAEPRGESSQA
jgi:hypothetical protein